MLRMRKEHVLKFSRAAEQDFVLRVRKHFREERPLQTSKMADSALDAITYSALDRAPAYRMESEYDVVRFVELILEFGMHFDEHPLVLRILSDPDPEIDVSDKIEAIGEIQGNRT